MKHDFRKEPMGADADRFCEWLLAETTTALARDYGHAESTKASIFLFVNRAFESHMPEDRIAEIFGKSIVRAGFQEHEQEPAFDWFELFAGIARGVYAGS